MQWYYLSDSHERLAISDAQFVPLAARGVLRPTTPVWRKGLADWTACGEIKPEIFAASTVARDSDVRNPVTDNVAVRGTVIGLSRTLAEYGAWFRIAGIAVLIASSVLLGWISWQAWMLIKDRADEIHGLLPFRAELDRRSFLDWAVCGVIAAESLSVVLGLWTGWLLWSSAKQAKQARETGSEAALHGAMRSSGRALAIVVAWGLILFIAATGLSLWLGWDKAFPPPPTPVDKGVVI